MTGFRRFLEKAAWLLALGLVFVLALSGMGLTSQLRAPEKVHYVGGGVAFHLVGTALMLSVIWGLKEALERFASIRLTGILALVWAVLAVVFVLGAGTRQEVDFAYVCEAAEQFARADYSAMQSYYFNEHSYQLGTVFLLECVLRLVPGADIGQLMQAVNVVMSICAAGLLASLGHLAFEEARVRSASMALYLLCLPMAVYCIHVYGTIPMVLLCAAAMLCFVRYIRCRQLRFGALYALLTALAYVIKPNSAIVLLALLICAALYTMESRDARLLGCAAVSVVLAVLLSRLVIAQYEWRSGVALREDVRMGARLVMGLQDGSRGAGWYNGYIEQFFDAAVSMEQEKAVVAADLSAHLDEMAADPVRTFIFLVQKALSQWLEPTYGTLIYGDYCQQEGPLAQAAQAVFSEESALRMALEGYMKLWQQALYVLCCVGLFESMRRRGGAAQLALPVAVLGGFAYHMIFEAKSQYIYVYALYLVPCAAYGLCTLGDWANRWRCGRGLHRRAESGNKE